MKLLVLQETDWIKRSPHQQHHLLDRMALRGHEIRVIDYDYLWKDDKEIKEQINEFKPDVIIAFGILNAYLGMRQAKKNNILFVYYLIGHLHTLLPGEFKRSIAKRFEKATLKGADKILVINKGLKDYAVEMGGDINKISVIPAGDLYQPLLKMKSKKNLDGRMILTGDFENRLTGCVLSFNPVIEPRVAQWI
jgi:hypothetical protein